MAGRTQNATATTTSATTARSATPKALQIPYGATSTATTTTTTTYTTTNTTTTTTFTTERSAAVIVLFTLLCLCTVCAVFMAGCLCLFRHFEKSTKSGTDPGEGLQNEMYSQPETDLAWPAQKFGLDLCEQMINRSNNASPEKLSREDREQESDLGLSKHEAPIIHSNKLISRSQILNREIDACAEKQSTIQEAAVEDREHQLNTSRQLKRLIIASSDMQPAVEVRKQEPSESGSEI